ncbi:beta-ketoacyl synthase N-terminal-like domain-containing protein, partial [Streptomyces sp. NPDC058045]|uniref:beta-ketoacyl synthase N-terminal-like domain-containing protein n=1 Tax=Streptomyces sp. NPDC058045 TaxID=3346311 RepID=UPI0036E04E4E
GGQGVASAYVLPVSAKSEEALERALLGLADHLDAEKELGEGYLASVAHTLSVGRHHFAHRCAVVARDVDDAVRLLREAARGEKPRKVHRGVVTRDFTPNAMLRDLVGEALRGRQDDGRYQETLLALGDLYCQGYAPQFQLLIDHPPVRISLPPYPFEEETYWPSPADLTRRLHSPVGGSTFAPNAQLGDGQEEFEEFEEEVYEDVEESAQPAAGGAAEVVAAGPGRRAEMTGFSVAECLEWELKDAVSQLLKLPVSKLDEGANLQDYGFDSISLVEFAGVLGERLGIELTPDVFFSHPTLVSLGRHLLDHHGELLGAFYQDGGTAGGGAVVPAAVKRRRVKRTGRRVRPSGTPAGVEPIGIVGMSGRFPGARSVDELWDILAEGRTVVGEVSPERQPAWGPGRPMGEIPGVAEFDPLFFEISPREAEVMDPRQRLLLQEMWRALEDAAYGPERLADEKVGVFVGVEEGDYVLLTEGKGSVTSNANSILASRLAYFLNLSGPSMAINTSCSSGLVALHEACLSLRYGDCDTAIVAGANILSTPGSYDAMVGAGMLSAEGVTRAFDRRADGMVPG